MADTTQQAVPGTGGSIDEVVEKHAGILALDDEDTREEGEAESEADEAEDESEGEDADDGDDSEESDEDNSEGDADDDDDSDEDADDEEDGEGEDEEDDEDEPTFKVKVNGEEIEVTESELKAGYSRQADYTRKTQALQKERKTFEEETGAVRAEREQYATLLDQLKQQVEAGGEKEPDWDALYAKDPDEWLRQRELWRSKRERMQAIEAEQKRVQQQQEAERSKLVSQRVAEEREKLVQAVPEWSNEEVAAKDMQQIARYAHDTIGFDEDEIEQIYDSRAVVALRKAMLYDALVSKRGKVKPGKGKGKRPKTSAPGHASAGSRKKPSRVQKAARQRLAEEGSVQSAASFLENSDLLD